MVQPVVLISEAAIILRRIEIIAGPSAAQVDWLLRFSNFSCLSGG
jgi:hypothetical protein